MNNPSTQSPVRVIRCAGCHQESPSDRKFCSQCGAKLWEFCVGCGATNAVDEKFCGACGVNIHQASDERVKRIQKKFELAIEFEREGRYFEAASALRAITSEGDPRLAHFESNAKKLLQELDHRRESKTREAEGLCAQATTYLSQHRHAKAIESLRSIPIGIRSEKMTSMLIEAEARHAEAQQLTRDIRAAVASKAWDGLLPNVQRLCTLQPHNEEAQKLAEKLSERARSATFQKSTSLATLVQQKLSERKYREAAEVANRIDPASRTGKIEQLYRAAKEVNWCIEQLARSTHATPVLRKVAQRWQKSMPEDERAEQTATQIGQRLQVKAKDQRFLLPPWKAPPDRPALGFRVENWNGLMGVKLADDVPDQIRQHGGRMMVAFGLALQGLGLAVLTHDLLPAQKSWGGLLQRRKAGRVWGLDIGSTAIKAMELVHNHSEGSTTVQRCLLLPHEKSLDTLALEEQEAMIASTLETFVEEAGTKKPRVALGFSTRRALPRFFEIPPVKGKKTEDLVGHELRHQIPIPIENTVHDAHVWPEGENAFRPVAAIAARREEMQQWVAPVQKAGCDVTLVQCDGFALYNAMHHQFQASPTQQYGTALALLDIGRTSSTLMIGESGFVWMRSIQLGTRRWNDAITRDLTLTHDQAERVRHDPSLVRYMHQVDASLSGGFHELVDEIQRSILAYPRQSSAAINLLLGVGGGFSQFGLQRYLLYGDADITIS